MNHDELTRIARAAYGPDPLAGLHMALAPHAPDSALHALRAVIGDALEGRRPVPAWMATALPEALAEAADALRARLAILDALSPMPDVPAWLGDVNAPDWEAGERYDDWRANLPEGMREVWSTLTPRQRALLAIDAEERRTRHDRLD